MLVRLAALALLLAATPSLAEEPQPTARQVEHFETAIRPLLAKRCVECHGEKKAEASLRLDRRDAAFAGGDFGAAIVPGDPDGSRIVEVLAHSEFDSAMPPTGKLPEAEIELLRKWIADGAPWPADREPSPAEAIAEAAKTHWAFQPIGTPEVPRIENDDWSRMPLDRFVLARLKEAGLEPSPEADRRTLIRRLSFDLRGLPPSFEEVEAFVADGSPTAYEDLVDRYLHSPAFGERWGRHWLDVARYADTKGYVFREDPNYPYAYTYRNYVVDAHNYDRPFTDFAREQIAADRLGLPDGDPRLAALGFLTTGPRLINNITLITDDRLDVTTRGFQGLTVACARCHDHKYDPVPTADYYSLWSILRSVEEPQLAELPVVGESPSKAAAAAFEEGLARQTAELDALVSRMKADAEAAQRTRVRDQLLRKLSTYPKAAKPQPIPYRGEPPRAGGFKRTWNAYLARRAKTDDPIWRPWHVIANLPAERLAEEAPKLIAKWQAEGRFHPRVLARLAEAEWSDHWQLAFAYGDVFEGVEAEWQAFRKDHPNAAGFDDDREPLRLVLYGPDSPTRIADKALKSYFVQEQRIELAAARAKLAKYIAKTPGGPPRAMVVRDGFLFPG